MKKSFLTLATLSARILPASVKRLIYSLPVAGLIRKQLNRVFPQETTFVTIAGGALQGLSMQLNLQTEKDYWLGTYETEIQSAILHFVKPGMVVYDVGANIGYISLLLAKMVTQTGHVYAFEALPANIARLQANLAANQFEQRVSVVPVAVVDEVKRVHFLIGPSTGMGKVEGSAGRNGLEYTHSFDVQGFSLDDFVYRQDNPIPQVIKVDIEGGEVMALPGMAAVLSEARPLLLLELHGPKAAQVAWESLHPAGYRLYRLTRGYPKIDRLEALDWKAYLLAKV
jgi:FkbM family methyltransferase